MDSYGVVNPNTTIPGFQPNMRVAYSTDGAAVYSPMIPPPPPFQGGGGGSPAVPPSQAKKKRGRPRKYEVEGGTTMSPLPLPPQTEVGFQPSGGGGGGTYLDAEDSGGIPEIKKTRGRPRKCTVEGGGVPSAAAAAAQLEAVFQASGLSSPAIMGSASAGKKAMGRPKGAKGRKQEQVADMGSAGLGFTPHVIIVQAGEDISTRIMSFSENGTRGLCVLSANGTVSKVTLRHASTSGGAVVTYEGRYDILRLSNPDMLVETGGQCSRTGRLSVTLAGPDGRIFGGSVAGVLTAASPVQVVLGYLISGQEDFILPTQAGREDFKSPTQAGREDFKSPTQAGPSTAPPNVVPGASAAGSPISWGTMSDSSGGPGSPLNQSTQAYNNGSNQQEMNSLSWLN
ncbi:AT-hook motif nuclear-localized protein 10-like isoform X1 [Rhododendron vialii]|uniref:AT-hook motif nuclear-localized protein 10-like isoform X1 n=1 Tax=Rhododendron vialii TaxID=182163 RepID=UPI00265E7432|nr:AT-hook motif nuclear-localized protein 10-like isoform X1 [Rhododendron vialii]